MDSNNTPTSGSAATPEQQQQHIRLACQACQRKKIKCDRHYPCGQCVRSGLQCAASSRKPRARHAGKRAIDSELRNRISKLESLVESLSGEVVGQDDESDADGDDAEKPADAKDPSVAVGKYMGSNFWSSLTTEVQALREALEEEPLDDVDSPETPSTSSNGPNSAEYELMLCPPGAIYVMPGSLTEPNAHLSATLCEVFCEYVDRLYKIFHTPSLRALMMEGKPYLGHEPNSPCAKAVKTSVWYAAVVTMSESQCQMLFGQSKHEQLLQYKRHADVALSQADLMVTNELATLQAFTTYIAAARMSDGSRRMWTLTALAVRIARAMGLDQENVPRSPYITELRRRLWHYVRFLDIYTALDRGTQPLLAAGSYDTPTPKNTNDSEFDEHSTTIPEREGFTDCSYPLLCAEALDYTHGLTVPNRKATGETWQARMEYSQNFEEHVQQKYSRYCDSSIPFQRLLSQVSNSMVNSMKLRAVRPLHSHPSSSPPRVDSPYVLKIAMGCLKASEAIHADAETAQYRWMVWVQWHALAVALAGLCSIRDTDLANEAWMLVEQAYARNIRVVADQRNGMLWKPVEKLYKKASTYRDHGRSLSISKDLFTPESELYMPSAPPQRPSIADQFGFPLKTESLPPQQQFPLPQNSIPGAMPTTGVLNSPMDLSSLDNSLLATNNNNMMMPSVSPGWNDVGNGDMSWMDFERMLEDLSNPVQNGIGADMGLQAQLPQQQGQQPWPQNLPPGEDWNGVLRQNLM